MKHEEPRSEVHEFTTNAGISMVMFLSAKIQSFKKPASLKKTRIDQRSLKKNN